MSVRAYTATVLLAGASALAIGGAAPAYALCDAYSGGCPSAPPADGGTGIGGGTDSPATGGDTTSGANGGDATSGAGAGGDEVATVDIGGTTGDQAGTGGGTGTTSNPSTLPFTGGELIMMTALGLGAVAGGTALVVAGRRKAGAPATPA